MNWTDSNPVSRLFDVVVDLPHDQRRQWLERDCPDEDTRREIESLLAAHDDAGDFLTDRSPRKSELDPHAVGSRIGAYELLELIGEGGFARVFRAEQSAPVRREVALKLIKLGMDTRAVIARFELERQALAMMDHPNIAAVYDAGATDTGRPYFVMELVRGPRLNRYCDDNRLDVRQRVRLFIDICRAMQHAHQKGILHRDLKPSNLLVTTVDGRAAAKIIDFGIAKAIQQRLTDVTIFTESQQMLGTPQYMSPEQARSGGTDVDTRSDIYSLGAVLYELLTGVPPLDAPSSSSHLEQLQRLTSDEELPRPSTRVIEQKRRELRGELDWIVMKCLEKDRSRRYESAAALAEDLEAFLTHRPIVAAPPSKLYRARKFVRRNALAVGAAAAVALALVAGTIVSTTQAVRATRAEQLSQKRLEESQAANASLTAVNDFLTDDMIGAADPDKTHGREITIREALDNASARLAGKFPDSPLIEAAVRSSVLMAYYQLGQAPRALPHAKEVLELRTRLLGDDHPDTIRALNSYGMILERMGQLSQARDHFKQAWDRARRTLGDDNLLTNESLSSYASTLMSAGRLAEAEPLFKQAWDSTRRALGDDHRKTIAALMLYARVIQLQGRAAEAEGFFREALGRSRRLLGDEHTVTSSLINYYAVVLKDLGRAAEAEPLQRQGLELRRRVLGEDHPATLSALANLADILYAQRRDAEAEPISRQAMEQLRRILKEDHPDTITSIQNYAEVLRRLGRLQEAEPYARDALASYRRVLGDDHPTTLVALSNYAWLLNSLGRPAEAETCFKDSLERGRRVRGADHPDTLVTMNNYAAMLRSVGRHADAQPLQAELYDRAMRAKIAPGMAAQFISSYGPCLIRLQRYEQAEAPLLEARRRLTETGQGRGPRMSETLNGLATVCERTNRPEEATRWRAELQSLGTPATRPAKQDKPDIAATAPAGPTSQNLAR